MKHTIIISLGGCSFKIDQDAYDAISDYLERYKAALSNECAKSERMYEIEERIADGLKTSLRERETVDLHTVQYVIGGLGLPEKVSSHSDDSTKKEHKEEPENRYDEKIRPTRKLYRDPDDKVIAGICSGLGYFLGIDRVIIRIILLVSLIWFGTGVWVYIIIWIAAPEARTPEEMCELRGIAPTPENLKRFTRE